MKKYKLIQWKDDRCPKCFTTDTHNLPDPDADVEHCNYCGYEWILVFKRERVNGVYSGNLVCTGYRERGTSE